MRTLCQGTGTTASVRVLQPYSPSIPSSVCLSLPYSIFSLLLLLSQGGGSVPPSLLFPLGSLSGLFEQVWLWPAFLGSAGCPLCGLPAPVRVLLCGLRLQRDTADLVSAGAAGCLGTPVSNHPSTSLLRTTGYMNSMALSWCFQDMCKGAAVCGLRDWKQR